MLAGVHEHCHVDRSPIEHAIGVFRCPRRQIARVKAIKRDALVDAESLRKTDETFIMLDRQVNVEIESCI